MRKQLLSQSMSEAVYLQYAIITVTSFSWPVEWLSDVMMNCLILCLFILGSGQNPVQSTVQNGRAAAWNHTRRQGPHGLQVCMLFYVMVRSFYLRSRNRELGMTSRTSWQRSTGKSDKQDGPVFSCCLHFFSSYLHIPARYLCRYCLLAFTLLLHCITQSVWLLMTENRPGV